MQAKHLLDHVQGPNAQLRCFISTQGPGLARCRLLRKTHRNFDEGCLVMLFSWTESSRCLVELDCFCTDLRQDRWSTFSCTRLAGMPRAADNVC